VNRDFPCGRFPYDRFSRAIFHAIELQSLGGGTTVADYRYHRGQCTTMSVNIRVRVRVAYFRQLCDDNAH